MVGDSLVWGKQDKNVRKKLSFHGRSFSQIRYNGADRRCEGGAFLSFSPKVLVMLSQAACREA